MSKASSEHSFKHSSQDLSKYSSKRSLNHLSSNSNNSRKLNVSKSKIKNYLVVNSTCNFGILQNPHSEAVCSNAVKNDNRSPREISAYSTLTEPFDPVNYPNNTPTMSSLPSTTSYFSNLSFLLERKKTLELATLEVKLAENQAKRKLELLEKSVQYQKQKIRNEALIAKEKVALVNFEQNLSDISQSSSSKSFTNSIAVSITKSSFSRLNHGDVYTQNNVAHMYKAENT